jgi:enoyl-CoA hydratase
MTSEVLTSAGHGLAHITLNRPQALHALNTAMCAAMIDALLAWRDDDAIHAALIDHAPGTRGFCAGGDIRVIAESGAGDGRAAREFFFTEYRLNHLLFHYPKPVIAIFDGVTMGGGVGISMPARFRIATENTTYAMPETGIGLFPDVGGGWYLPRKPGQIGMWLALTGARLKAADCLIAGIATHYVEAAKLEALKRALEPFPAPSRGGGRGGGGRAEDGADGAVALHPDRAPSQPSPARGEGLFEQTLARFATNPGAPRELTPDAIARINRIFAHDSVEAIFAALEADASEWANAQLATLRTKSPQTLKVSFRQLREGAAMQSFADEMRQEYRIAVRVSSRHDFLEGVRALIVDKDNKPAWNPSTLAGVTDAMLDEIFAPLPSADEWTPLVVESAS